MEQLVSLADERKKRRQPDREIELQAMPIAQVDRAVRVLRSALQGDPETPPPDTMILLADAKQDDGTTFTLVAGFRFVDGELKGIPPAPALELARVLTK